MATNERPIQNTKQRPLHAAISYQELNQFHGDMTRFRSVNPVVYYTPGVRYLAERAGAYWLVDTIASYYGTPTMQNAMYQDERLWWLHFWRLELDDERRALLTARADDDEEPFVSREIPFTDFPLRGIAVWAGYDRRFWTLYLPSEH